MYRRRRNLKSLIRFEDTYGLTDIFCARMKIPYIEIYRKQEKMIEITNEIFIDFGLGSSWGMISTDEAYDIMERGIERIVLVYDMDSLHGDKTSILTNNELQSRINNVKNIFKHTGYNVEICLIPVVYAAETIMLYQYLTNGTENNIQDLVSSVNTWKLHLYLLAYMMGESNTKKAKKVRDFIDINKLILILEESAVDLNYLLKQWIINGCNLDSKDLMNEYSALEHLNKVTNHFNKWFRKSLREITIDEHTIKLYEEIKPLIVK